MKTARTALALLLGALALSGCAVYPAYEARVAYPAPEVVAPAYGHVHVDRGWGWRGGYGGYGHRHHRGW